MGSEWANSICEYMDLLKDPPFKDLSVLMKCDRVDGRAFFQNWNVLNFWVDLLVWVFCLLVWLSCAFRSSSWVGVIVQHTVSMICSYFFYSHMAWFCIVKKKG